MKNVALHYWLYATNKAYRNDVRMARKLGKRLPSASCWLYLWNQGVTSGLHF